jgi:PleD family two-component response regulator
LATFDPTLRSAAAMRSKQHGLNFEIQNSFQRPANPVIDGQPNACLSRVRLSEPLAGEQSAIESRSGGMPGEVGHILVVNDDAMVRQTITNYLEEHNVPAASVSSRHDLGRHLEKAHPSLILLDLRLGQEDGLDVLKEIRSHSAERFC